MKCVNFIEIQYIFLYTISPYTLTYMFIMFDTTAQIPEVEFGGKYWYWPREQVTNTDFWLLLDMQMWTYCNKICDTYLQICYLYNHKKIQIKYKKRYLQMWCLYIVYNTILALHIFCINNNTTLICEYSVEWSGRYIVHSCLPSYIT